MYGSGQSGYTPQGPPQGGYNSPQPVLGANQPGHMRLTLSKVDPFSLAKISAISGALMGLIMGLFASLFIGPMMAAMGGSKGGGVGLAAGMGIASIIVYPILYAIGGFIGGLIYGALYNVASKMVGGIQYEVDQTY